jgi:hypothetical protein
MVYRIHFLESKSTAESLWKNKHSLCVYTYARVHIYMHACMHACIRYVMRSASTIVVLVSKRTCPPPRVKASLSFAQDAYDEARNCLRIAATSYADVGLTGTQEAQRVAQQLELVNRQDEER